MSLGSARNFAILAKSGISSVPASAITGNLGLSPAAASFITGFSLTADSTNVFSTSTQVTGRVFAADYASPTPSNLTTAVLDMQTAYTAAAGRAPGGSNIDLFAGSLGGQTLAPGVYKWNTNVTIPTSVTISGTATDVWIFQIAGNLTQSNATIVTLAGGALAKNIFWQVAGKATLGTTSDFKGNILCQTLIALQTGAQMTGRALAQTAVTLDATAITAP